MGLYSRKALEMVAEAYEKCSVKRFEYIGRRIDETLQKGEAAMLFIREGHMVHFAKDIEVFSVAPPALDDIHRWLRDRSKQTEEKDEEKKN
jgi:anthranilate phosphoribosyltransferase